MLKSQNKEVANLEVRIIVQKTTKTVCEPQLTYTYLESKEFRLEESQAMLTTESSQAFGQVVVVLNMIRCPYEYISAVCNSAQHL